MSHFQVEEYRTRFLSVKFSAFLCFSFNKNLRDRKKVMNNKLYVGNLSFHLTEDDLGEFFAQVGTVESAKIIEDRDTGRSRGFGFVEMSSEEEAQAAIEQLNGEDLDGRNVVINEARPREERGGGHSRGHGGGYGGGGGNRW